MFIRKYRYILLGLIIILLTIFLLPNYKLKEFMITSVEDVDGTLNVICEKQKNAIKYVARIYENDNLVESFPSNTNRIPIDLRTINNGDTISIKVTAFNKLDETIDSNPFSYTYNYPTFTVNSSPIITKNRTFAFDIAGEIDDTYKIEIIYQNNKVFEINNISNYTNLNYKDVSQYKGRLTANLVNKKGRIVSTVNFYNNPTMVSDVKIVSPDIYTIQKSDVAISYKGGDNATSVSLHIIKEDKTLRVIPVNNVDKLIRVSSKYLEEGNTYKFKIVASYEDYKELAKTDEIDIFISPFNQVLPPYINHYEAKIKKGTEVTLKTKTDNAHIKYTIDGRDPKKYGTEYTDPIVINKDTVVKAFAYKVDLDDSPIETFDFKINSDIRTIYLSPSSQDLNYGVRKAGFTTEMEWMNKVCDVVEKKLRDYDVKVLRNDPKAPEKMMNWLADSRRAKSDLHIALHSNGSVDHDEQGMEVWVEDENSLAYSFANVLYDNLYDIYPYKGGGTNRGVKYALGSLGEVNTLNISRGVLIEIAFHDNYDDAKWIVDNYEKIGENIAKTIVDFYQIGG